MKTDLKPTVSVIIATYNREKHLERSIDSVFAQTYKDFEIIIVDDGSTDNTHSLLKKIYDDKIIYLKHDCNKGISSARNTGIKHAKGDYIAFHDSDDEWLPDKLMKQMALFQSSGKEVGAVYCGFNQFNGDEVKYYPGNNIKQFEGNIHFELLRNNFVSTQTVVIRRECFDQVGLFDEAIPKLVDWELNIRISAKYHFACVNSPLVNAYLQEDSITRSMQKTIEAYMYLLNKHGHLIKALDQNLYTKYMYYVGILSLKEGNIINAFKHLSYTLTKLPFFFLNKINTRNKY